TFGLRGVVDYHPPSVTKYYISTFNVRSLLSEKRVIELEHALSGVKWDIIGISEVTREGFKIEDRVDYVLYYYGKKQGYANVTDLSCPGNTDAALPFLESEVELSIQKLKSDKSPGPDGVTNEMLSSSATAGGWAHVRLALLLGGILAAGSALLATAVLVGLPAGRDTFAFMAAESEVRVAERVAGGGAGARDPHGGVQQHAGVHGVARAAHAAATPAARAAGAPREAPSLHRARDAHHTQVCTHSTHRTHTHGGVQQHTGVHGVARAAHAAATPAARAAGTPREAPPKHRARDAHHTQDNCAICWEPMKEARKLPCAHLFHKYVPSPHPVGTLLACLSLVVPVPFSSCL
ncbi:Endonuclease-reverse transcriptase, partial [Operophtera brumata]